VRNTVGPAWARNAPTPDAAALLPAPDDAVSTSVAAARDAPPAQELVAADKVLMQFRRPEGAQRRRPARQPRHHPTALIGPNGSGKGAR